MNTEKIAGTGLGKLAIRLLGAGMESRFRYRFFGPTNILKGAGILPGQAVMELGCGTGYFTIPAARLIGEQGRLVSMDILPESVELIAGKVKALGLKNVRVVKGDAQDTGLEAESFDMVLLFGVIPSPMLPLTSLLPEVRRVLRKDGRLAVWPPVPGWLPDAITRSGLFTYLGKQGGVSRFGRC